MRISDWSSDVCSSDLTPADAADPHLQRIASFHPPLIGITLSDQRVFTQAGPEGELMPELPRQGSSSEPSVATLWILLRLRHRGSVPLPLDRKSTRLNSSH